ncbi:YdeI/OmpD-associated family protein [Micropruina sp.]|uniref:YdeI/OmpD-associated family protein n=1 Tax=Micropruina sp. TaxID=2737536 RepID=UPI0039E6F907
MTTWIGGTPDRPARFFSGPDAFDAWLAEHHATQTELWVGLFKKHAADRGLTWADAVPVALCWGWIDSVLHRIDDDTVRQRWTPRKPTSNWSKVNIALVAELTAQGRMRPPGIAAFERRRLDDPGYSYEVDGLHLPARYEARLRADAAAADFFYRRATASYRRVCIGWVLQAKTAATRDKRMAELIVDSAAGRLIRTQRYGTPPTWARPVAEPVATQSDNPAEEAP